MIDVGDQVVCFTCAQEAEKGLMKDQSVQVDSCSVKGGFTNWPKATEKFKEQEKSPVHNEALLLRLPARPEHSQTCPGTGVQHLLPLLLFL